MFLVRESLDGAPVFGGAAVLEDGRTQTGRALLIKVTIGGKLFSFFHGRAIETGDVVHCFLHRVAGVLVSRH